MSEEAECVTRSSHIWTAVSNQHEAHDRKTVSFSYLGENHPGRGIRLMSVSNLNIRLSEHYSKLSDTCRSIEIFADNCFGDSNKLIHNVWHNVLNPQVPPLTRIRGSGISEAFLAHLLNQCAVMETVRCSLWTERPVSIRACTESQKWWHDVFYYCLFWWSTQHSYSQTCHLPERLMFRCYNKQSKNTSHNYNETLPYITRAIPENDHQVPL